MVVFLLAGLAEFVFGEQSKTNFLPSVDGGIVRGPSDTPKLALVFTGDTFAEGANTVLDQLQKHRAKASFFLTGDFLANTNFRAATRRIVREGHYLGPHSDKHLLYCSWEGPKRTLISHQQFQEDLQANLRKIEGAGFRENGVHYFLPPYEHYNSEIVRWAKELGLTLINYTPGTRSNADYTGETEKNFVSSEEIFQSIVEKEKADPKGLNGFILLLHIGVGAGRQDKFAPRFGELLDFLQAHGYAMVRVDSLLERK
jgi:endoglucanase